jgi:hypothetical protein
MKFTRVLLGVFALLLAGEAITLVSQEKSSPTRATYTYAPTSEQTMRGWVVETKDFQCPGDRHSGLAHHGEKRDRKH